MMIEDATQQGVVVVSAAGNLGNSVEQYPAANQCALGVTSVGSNSVKSIFANHGEWVAFAAPGESIYSAYPGSSYAWWSGTSMAAPFAAGQAALLRSLNPSVAASLQYYMSNGVPAFDYGVISSGCVASD
jgi:thermitase